MHMKSNHSFIYFNDCKGGAGILGIPNSPERQLRCYRTQAVSPLPHPAWQTEHRARAEAKEHLLVMFVSIACYHVAFHDKLYLCLWSFQGPLKHSDLFKDLGAS